MSVEEAKRESRLELGTPVYKKTGPRQQGQGCLQQKMSGESDVLQPRKESFEEEKTRPKMSSRQVMWRWGSSVG